MSFHVLKWPDISNGWSDIPSEKEANKKGGEKTMGGKIGSILTKGRTVLGVNPVHWYV